MSDVILGFQSAHFFLIALAGGLSWLTFAIFKSSRQNLWLVVPGILGLILSVVILFVDAIPGGDHPSVFYLFILSLVYTAISLLIKIPKGRDWVKSKLLIIYFANVCAYFSDNIMVFSICWAISAIPLVSGGMKTTGKSFRKIFFPSQASSFFLMIIGFTILYLEKGRFLSFGQITQNDLDHGTNTTIALVLMTCAAFLRQGLFPFHLWCKSLFQFSPFPLSMAFYTGNLGFVLFHRMVIPLISWESHSMFIYVMVWGILSACFFSQMSFVQDKVRLSAFYVMLSQYSTLFCSLALHDRMGKVGAYFQFLSLGCSFTGLISLIYIIEDRLMTLRTRTYYGLQFHNPQLMTIFLLLALSTVALPFSMNFIGEDIIFHAAIEHYPYLGIGLIVAAAFNGINIFRLFSGIFRGEDKSPLDTKIKLTKWQQTGFVILILVILSFGVFPESLLGHIIHLT